MLNIYFLGSIVNCACVVALQRIFTYESAWNAEMNHGLIAVRERKT